MIKNIIYISLLLLSSTACEMKNELKGISTGDKTERGFLQIVLDSKQEATAPASKAKKDITINDFPVEILDSKGQIFKKYDTYADLQRENPILLPAGPYVLKSYYGELKDASREAYYESSKSFIVEKGKKIEITDTCRLATVKMALALTPEFLEVFDEDYSITITNHDKGILIYDKQNTDPMYFKTNAEKTRISLAIKARNRETGRDIEVSQEIIKQGDYDNGAILPGDFFNIKIDTTYSMNISTVYPKLVIDLTMIKTDITVSVPTENLIPPTDPTPDPDPDPTPDPTDGPLITGDGVDKPITFAIGNALPAIINVDVPSGIEQFKVTIITSDTDLQEILLGMDLGSTFDMADTESLSALQQEALTDLGLITEGEVLKGAKEKVFDISPFMPLLPIGEHTFRLSVTDANELNNTKAINVIVTE